MPALFASPPAAEAEAPEPGPTPDAGAGGADWSDDTQPDQLGKAVQQAAWREPPAGAAPPVREPPPGLRPSRASSPPPIPRDARPRTGEHPASQAPPPAAPEELIPRPPVLPPAALDALAPEASHEPPEALPAPVPFDAPPTPPPGPIQNYAPQTPHPGPMQAYAPGPIAMPPPGPPPAYPYADVDADPDAAAAAAVAAVDSAAAEANGEPRPAKAVWKQAHPSARRWVERRQKEHSRARAPSPPRIALGLLVAALGVWLLVSFLPGRKPLTPTERDHISHQAGVDLNAWRFHRVSYQAARGIAGLYLTVGFLIALRGMFFRRRRDVTCRHCGTQVTAERSGLSLRCPNGHHTAGSNLSAVALLVSFAALTAGLLVLVVVASLTSHGLAG